MASSVCSGSSGEDQNQNRSNEEPKDVLALLAAKDNLTNSVDVEEEFDLPWTINI